MEVERIRPFDGGLRPRMYYNLQVQFDVRGGYISQRSIIYMREIKTNVISGLPKNEKIESAAGRVLIKC